MGMSNTVQRFLDERHANYEVMPHMHTFCSMETAQAAHVPGDQVAKSVILKDEMGYVMAVIPSTYHVAVQDLNRYTGRHLHLAAESDLKSLFKDCEIGAIPPLGQAYGIKTVMDRSLMRCQDIYFEAGTHEDLIHMDTDTFLDLMAEADSAQFSRRNPS